MMKKLPEIAENRNDVSVTVLVSGVPENLHEDREMPKKKGFYRVSPWMDCAGCASCDQTSEQRGGEATLIICAR
jgi:hypothetical protein